MRFTQRFGCLVVLTVSLATTSSWSGPLSVSPSLGSDQTDMDLTYLFDEFGRDRCNVMVNSQGYTDLRYIGTHGLPWLLSGQVGLDTRQAGLPVNTQHPGLGFRWNHRLMKPTGLVLSLADLRQPLPGVAWFVDQRLTVCFGPRTETSYRNEFSGRASVGHEWYLSQVVDWRMVRGHWRSFSYMNYCVFRQQFGYLRIGLGLREEARRRPRGWSSIQHAVVSLQFDRFLSRTH